MTTFNYVTPHLFFSVPKNTQKKELSESPLENIFSAVIEKFHANSTNNSKASGAGYIFRINGNNYDYPNVPDIYLWRIKTDLRIPAKDIYEIIDNSKKSYPEITLYAMGYEKLDSIQESHFVDVELF